MEENNERYDLNNLPISDKTREGLTPENINYIGAVGRMLLLQDNYNEKLIDQIAIDLAEVTTATNAKIFKLLEDQHTLILAIKTDIGAIKRRLDIIEDRLDTRDVKIALLEKYASFGNTAARIAVGIIIGIAIGWLLHSLLLV